MEPTKPSKRRAHRPEDDELSMITGEPAEKVLKEPVKKGTHAPSMGGGPGH